MTKKSMTSQSWSTANRPSWTPIKSRSSCEANDQLIYLSKPQITNLYLYLWATDIKYYTQMSNKNLTLARLNKEEKSLINDPLLNVIVKRKGILDFHFCLYNLDSPYQGGFYHGVMQLAEDYPFSPPKIKFFTPSGRYEVDKYVCTTFTNFHKEEWSTAWNVRSMLTALVSFIMSAEGGTGWMKSSDLTKMSYAHKSLQSNMENPLFRELFGQHLLKNGLQPPNVVSSNEKPARNRNSQEVQSSNSIYFLILVVILVIIGYAAIKNEQGSQKGGEYKQNKFNSSSKMQINSQVYNDDTL